jgi:alkanesulfonate monooxygenase SsuD/methylene tetrahydromethanopterin reductase-like flavin-dependent oxidoreductase (luciferase family)
MSSPNDGGADLSELRFCSYQYQRDPFPVLEDRWRAAEELGFDVLWNVDAVVEPDLPGHPIFDGPSTLAMMATHTSRIRIGTLVSSLYFRNPVTLTKATVTVDRRSDGRVELALGVGDPSVGAAAAGLDWPPPERVERFREFVELVDLLLRQEMTEYEGRYFRCDRLESYPRPVQSPRPPITIAAHGPKMMKIAAEFADGWSSWGGYDVQTEDDFFAVTKDRNARFDDLCSSYGRDPRGIRHSLVCFPPLTPWESASYFEDLIGRYRSIGIDEFVVYWPGHWRDEPREDIVFEEVCRDVIPRLRTS